MRPCNSGRQKLCAIEIKRGFCACSQPGCPALLVVAFQVITLPVEFNASARAIRLLGDTGILSDQENSGAKKVLGAAAMTYVASVLASLLQLLRLVILFGGRRRDE